MENRINSARLAVGWSIADLARNLKMPYRTAQNYCLGLRKCPEWVERLVIAEIERIAKNEKS